MVRSFQEIAEHDARLIRIGPIQRQIIEILAWVDVPAYEDQLAFVLAIPEPKIRRACARLKARGILCDPESMSEDEKRDLFDHRFMQIMLDKD